MNWLLLGKIFLGFVSGAAGLIGVFVDTTGPGGRKWQGPLALLLIISFGISVGLEIKLDAQQKEASRIESAERQEVIALSNDTLTKINQTEKGLLSLLLEARTVAGRLERLNSEQKTLQKGQAQIRINTTPLIEKNLIALLNVQYEIQAKEATEQKVLSRLKEYTINLSFKNAARPLESTLRYTAEGEARLEKVGTRYIQTIYAKLRRIETSKSVLYFEQLEKEVLVNISLRIPKEESGRIKAAMLNNEAIIVSGNRRARVPAELVVFY